MEGKGREKERKGEKERKEGGEKRTGERTPFFPLCSIVLAPGNTETYSAWWGSRADPVTAEGNPLLPHLLLLPPPPSLTTNGNKLPSSCPCFLSGLQPRLSVPCSSVFPLLSLPSWAFSWDFRIFTTGLFPSFLYPSSLLPPYHGILYLVLAFSSLLFCFLLYFSFFLFLSLLFYLCMPPTINAVQSLLSSTVALSYVTASIVFLNPIIF